MGLSKCEMETYISFMADSREAVIFSSDPVWIRKLKKMSYDHPENYRIKEIGTFGDEEISITVLCSDKGLVSLKGKRQTLSDEQKAIRGERLRALRRINSESESLQNSVE